MKTVLVLYQSRSGHTARIARRIWETVIAEGNQADLMDVVEADREGLDWNKSRAAFGKRSSPKAIRPT